ncbi:MAG TPA: Stp1/IreP family PP2C-type Ser/Thr phosphatase [Acidimicrobiales bacterium]|nr:Stp1/IreP family PP2C-type Ser/Thr phosphatase [Acidimicrobiales bacterium]
MTQFRAGSATDVGRVRSNNQDSHLVREGELFAVADGMGGHQGGEVASATALEILGRAYDEPSTPTLVRAVRSANQAVFDKASGNPDLKGMGTTLTALADVETPEGPRLAIVNVGDSRLYRLRGDELEQLTEDHSLVASLFRQGRITEEEMENHPQRNILTRALGIDEAVAVDSWEVEPVVGDRFLICSDGLFNEVTTNKIVATMRQFDDPVDAASELVRLANEGGGRDNITAVIVEVTGTDDAGVTTLDKPTPAATPVPAPGPEPTRRHDAIRSTLPYAQDDVPDAGGGDGTGVIALDEGQDDDLPEPKRMTWRVVAFVLALLALLVVVAGALGWYARNTYFVRLDDEQVVIYKGRPGGFLWFDATVEQETGIAAEDVPEARRDELEEGVDQATLDGAESYVENLEEQIEEDRPSTTTTTSTTRVTTTTTAPNRPDGGGGGGGTGTKPGGNG